MYRKLAEQHKGTLPFIGLVRWRPVNSKGRRGTMDLFSLVERDGKAESGFRYTCTKEAVDGDHVEIRNSILSIWDRVYHVYGTPNVGEGVHFTASSVWHTEEMLLENIASNIQFLCKKNVLEVDDDKLQLVTKRPEPDLKSPELKVRFEDGTVSPFPPLQRRDSTPMHETRTSSTESTPSIKRRRVRSDLSRSSSSASSVKRGKSASSYAPSRIDSDSE